jgi:anti-sigma28 factor (negative regulator of flagellin synthesis)
MHISNNMSISGADAVRGASKAAAPSQVQSPEMTEFASVPDQLELSPEALAIGGESTGETFRAGRVAELRAAIADGNYDTDELFEKAIQKMIDRLA